MSVQHFEKYDRLGPYHWRKVFGPWWRVSPVTSGLYLAAVKAIGARMKLKGARGLDVGCGDGVILRLCAERGAQMVGLDGSGTALRLALQLCSDACVDISCASSLCLKSPENISMPKCFML
jgi:2-polyprenyl-3-methyl-5-hydroxy-6-metoxy-1,4-benzoquinol methylase